MPDSARESAYIKWVPETDSGRNVKTLWVAWLVRDIVDDLGTRTQFLAYLGGRPRVTTDLQFEVSELYPDLEVDWDNIRQSLESRQPQTDVQSLSDDEFVFRFRPTNKVFRCRTLQAGYALRRATSCRKPRRLCSLRGIRSDLNGRLGRFLHILRKIILNTPMAS